jgi:hypothetical protein
MSVTDVLSRQRSKFVGENPRGDAKSDAFEAFEALGSSIRRRSTVPEEKPYRVEVHAASETARTKARDRINA